MQTKQQAMAALMTHLEVDRLQLARMTARNQAYFGHAIAACGEAIRAGDAAVTALMRRGNWAVPELEAFHRSRFHAIAMRGDAAMAREREVA